MPGGLIGGWQNARKNVGSVIDGRFYYLTAIGHAYGKTQKVKIDTHKDFEIETLIKILSGNSNTKLITTCFFRDVKRAQQLCNFM